MPFIKQVKKPIRILHIFGRMQKGGAEMRTMDIMRNIDNHRYQFHFCTLSGLEGELDDEIRTLGGKVYLCKLGYSFPRSFRQLLRQSNFDVVHSHVHHFSGYILRLAAKEYVPTRIAHFRTVYDGHNNSLRRKLQRKLLKYWIDRYATHILAVSKIAMSSSWTMWESDPRCEVIYSGLDSSNFDLPSDRHGVRSEFGMPGDSKLFIHIGRMDRAKNHDRIISIFYNLVQRDPFAYLLLVGRGGNEIEQRLRTKIEQLIIKNRVVFAGLRSDIPRLLRAADLMLFPSIWEGLPGVILEACAAGIPVLASDLPAVREIAEHFTSVRHLSLEIDDEKWVNIAQELCCPTETKGHCGVHPKAMKEFERSPFNIRSTIKKLENIYCN